MAILTRGVTLGASEVVTNTKLHNLVDSGNCTSIIDSDIAANAAISYSKLELTGSITDADINSSASLSDSKFSQITTAGKVSAASIVLLPSLPSGAGVIPSANLPQTYAFIKVSNQQTSGTNGGSLNSGAWRVLTLNTKDTDTAAIATLASNQISLPSGTYLVDGFIPVYGAGTGLQVRLQNITDATTILSGTSVYMNAGGTTIVPIKGLFTISGTKTIEFQAQIGSSVGTTAQGQSSSLGTEIYAQLCFYKIIY